MSANDFYQPTIGSEFLQLLSMITPNEEPIHNEMRMTHLCLLHCEMLGKLSCFRWCCDVMLDQVGVYLSVRSPSALHIILDSLAGLFFGASL